MLSLGLGLIAALAWGIHDLCVRLVSQKQGITGAIFGVMCFGTLFVAPFSLTAIERPEWDAMGWAALAGVVYGFAGFALYRAFAIGPVRLVAPIIGSYPVLSVAWAGIAGQAADPGQWIAVICVIAGVGYVVRQDDEGAASQGTEKEAIFWSVSAAICFAATFALGQYAARNGAELALMMPTRLAALAVIVGVGLAMGQRIWPARKVLPVLAVMGALDGIALGLVMRAGTLERPEFASVAASLFGLITVVLAAIFLKERIKPAGWAAVVMVFAAIGYLGL